ncbi:MAG: hypothetical protein ACT6FG_08635, partial [Methanosarcinaceae archaeon]
KSTTSGSIVLDSWDINKIIKRELLQKYGTFIGDARMRRLRRYCCTGSDDFSCASIFLPSGQLSTTVINPVSIHGIGSTMDQIENEDLVYKVSGSKAHNRVFPKHLKKITGSQRQHKDHS